jgi:hypothetical protein
MVVLGVKTRFVRMNVFPCLDMMAILAPLLGVSQTAESVTPEMKRDVISHSDPAVSTTAETRMLQHSLVRKMSNKTIVNHGEEVFSMVPISIPCLEPMQTRINRGHLILSL